MRRPSTTAEYVARETEARFQAAVIEAARLCGWDHYHTHDSRRSVEGWPDLALWRPRVLSDHLMPQFILAELKAVSGRLTPTQRAMHASLRESGLRVYVWRPSDWDEIVAVLREGV